MSTATAREPGSPDCTPGTPVSIPVHQVERELARQFAALQAEAKAPVVRARMSNLVIYCDTPKSADTIAEQLPAVVAVHPARVLLLVGDRAESEPGIRASVSVEPQGRGARQPTYSETVVLHAGRGAVDRLPFAVRALVIGDLPVNLWWAAAQPPPFGAELLHGLTEQAQQILYDSSGWPDPARDLAATAAWLEQIERTGPAGRWRVAADLNWRRLKYWRRLVSQALDPGSAAGAVESITDVRVEHGPGAVIQAWQLVSWGVQRLGWRMQPGKVAAAPEMVWRFTAPPANDVRLCIRRLDEGPAEIVRVRLACTIAGRPGVMNLSRESPERLTLTIEGSATAPRTIAVPPQSAADLVGRQLSDRQRDPVFRESMTAARALAQCVL
jgi:glucose-6-phosphate dehydrogenase assembly protein OpcA